MKLRFDQTLSDRLVGMLSSHFPGSTHVRNAGLASASDWAVWEHARAQGFTIVTKDVDFHEWSVLRGHPPKVIWIRRGNCSTTEIASILIGHRDLMESFDRDDRSSVIELH